MRNLLLLLMFCLVFHFTKAQAKSDPFIAAQIDQQVWEPFKEAYADRDGPKYVRLHTDDVLRVTPWGIKHGEAFKRSTIERYARPNQAKRSIDFRFEHRIHTDSISYEVGYYKVVTLKGGEDKREDYGRFHVVLKKVNGLWKIAQDWDTDNINGHEVGSADFDRLDSIQNEIRVSLSLQNIKPEILGQEGHELFQYWEMKNDPVLWAFQLGEVPALAAYKDTILITLGEAGLMAKLKKEQTQPVLSNNNTPNDSLNNAELVHQGYLGAIRPINFIEAEILNYQLSRFPLFSHPTELHGFIMHHDSLDLVRIYFGASDAPWPPKPKAIIPHLENALQNGWRLIQHLHNHYNEKEGNYIGVMAPSLADAHYYKALRDRFQLREALITNGYTTVVLKAEEFDTFNSH